MKRIAYTLIYMFTLVQIYLNINLDTFVSYVLKSCASYDVHGVNMSADEDKTRKISNGSAMDWSSSRRSVHEMIKRFQQVPDMHNNWHGIRSGNSEPASLNEHTKCSQNMKVHSQGEIYVYPRVIKYIQKN